MNISETFKNKTLVITGGTGSFSFGKKLGKDCYPANSIYLQ